VKQEKKTLAHSGVTMKRSPKPLELQTEFRCLFRSERGMKERTPRFSGRVIVDDPGEVPVIQALMDR